MVAKERIAGMKERREKRGWDKQPRYKASGKKRQGREGREMRREYIQRRANLFI